MQQSSPSDLVVVGRILDAWGLRGEIKVMPYAHDGSALLEVRQWWMERAGQWESLEVVSAKSHGELVTASLVGISSREVAERFKGCEVWISRARFPVLPDDEYYWVDLIGLQVVNAEGLELGVVRSMLDNGAHAILEIERVVLAGEKPGAPTVLIPFVERYVRSVDRVRARIVVDWGPEYEG
jgi:16S rRNA processing protein RimM